jgi:hypothetical protein
MLEEIIARGNRGHVGYNNPNWIDCADGFRVSVLAGGGVYCVPRPALCACGIGEEPYPFMDGGTPHDYPGPYTRVEVGFPSARPEPWAEWSLYAESPDDPQESVYGNVPVELVRALIASHGGEKNG